MSDLQQREHPSVGTPPTMQAAPSGRRSRGTAPEGERRSPGKRLAALTTSTEFQLLVGLTALVAIFLAMYPETFRTSQNLRNMTTVAGILLVVAIGQTIVLLIGGFDLSVAANMGFVSVVAALHMTQGGGVVSGIALALGCGALVGLANGVLIAILRITPFVATLGTLTFLKGYTNLLSNGQSVPGLPPEFSRFGGGDWGFIPSALGIAVGVLVLAWVLLTRTRLGLYIYAIGGSRETARTAGVVVTRYELAAYVLCGLFAGLGGVMLASRVTVGQDSLGQGYDLLSIATAVIGGVAIGGGTGRLCGVVLGVSLLVVLTTGLDIAGLSPFVKQMVTGSVLILAVIIAQLRGYDLAAVFRIQSRSRPSSPVSN